MSGSIWKFPEEADLAEQIREAAATRTPLEIVGGGSKLALGRPVMARRRLMTAQLSGITLHEPGSLTVSVKAGTRLAELQRQLAAERQHLAFEPPDYSDLLGTKGQPTIGGVVACGLSGPRRIHSGAARDALLGVRAGELEDRVGRAAILERADLLEVLALEIDAPAREPVEGRGGHHRRAMNDPGDVRRGVAHRGQVTGVGC